MATAPSFDDYFNLGKAEAIARQPSLTFDSGDISEFLVVSAAAMADHATGYAASLFRDLYLDGAAGDALTTLADDRYAIVRQAATNAIGQVTFSRPLPGSNTPGTIVTGTVVATTKDAEGNEVQFATTQDAVFGNLTTTVTVNAQCTVTGSDGNVLATKINRIISSVFDTTITVSNAARFAGGAAEETDEALRERVRNYPTTIRRGTAAALEYGALTVAGVGKATVSETDSGIVSLYISDVDGNSNTLLTSAVQNEIINWRAAGTALNVFGGVPITVPIAVVLNVRAGVDVNVLIDNVKAAIVSRVNKLKINETLYKSNIQQAVLNVDSNILECQVALPVLDTTPADGELIHVTTGDITVA